MATDAMLVEELRAVSRSMVRALGFMGGDFAGTDLSPSAVHALLEIEGGGVSARDLAEHLRLEKSSVSRLLRKLVDTGEVLESAGTGDGRVKHLALSDSGRRRVAAIHAFARAQVAQALGRLQPGQDHAVLGGMRLYADALAGSGPQPRSAPEIEIRPGYQTALIARITQMHAVFYARQAGFGQAFESVVAAGLAEFCGRLERPGNGIWTALQGGHAVGSVAIDGEDLGAGMAHLRWFIVDDSALGLGAGRRLLQAALDFVDARGCPETHLWTFSGLVAARRLYEAHGFRCVEERPGRQWGQEVLEQRFVRQRP